MEIKILKLKTLIPAKFLVLQKSIYPFCMVFLLEISCKKRPKFRNFQLYATNRIFLFISLVAGVLLFLPNYGYSQSGAFEQIKLLENTEHEALIKKYTVTLKKIGDVNFMVNAPINKVSPNRRHILNLVKAGFISYSSFDRQMEDIRKVGDFIITMGNETVVPSAGRPHQGETIHRRYTHVWQFKKGHWLLIARHANIICN